MTISSTTNRVSFAGNSSTTVFSFPYYFLANADLVVISKNDTTGVETTKTITTDYTVTGAGVPAGGSVTMLSAPATGTTLVIYRDPAKVQDLDLVENDPMPAEEIEERLDKLTMIVQRLQDQIDRAITLTNGYSGTFTNLKLPALIEASKLLRINSGATGFDLVDSESASFDSGSPLTTKGDLLTYYTGTNQRLPVGTDGQQLIADSGQTSGLRWGTTGAFKYDAIVGSTAQVTSGVATHDTIAAGITAAGTGGTVKLLAGAWTENIAPGARINIIGSGYDSIITGNVTLSSVSNSSLSDFRISGDVTVSGTSTGNTLTGIFIGSGASVTDTNSVADYGNFYHFIKG